MINISKPFMPPFSEYAEILKKSWDKAWITNNGELLIELENRLKDYLGVKHLFLCSNGSVVLQIALKACGITRDVITTPFSYVATTNAILLEGCRPVFVDIAKDSFCLDAEKIERAITGDTQAILATHVYGNSCDINKIQTIAVKYNLKIIYDGAHAFGCTINDKSLLSYGDISTCSFHATKIFQTAEGGCVITSDAALAEKLNLLRQHGHINNDYKFAGLNAKNSELHAALGLAILPYRDKIIQAGQRQWNFYFDTLKNLPLQFLNTSPQLKYNFSYFPIVFSSEKLLESCITRLKLENIFPRRYFYPALNKLPYVHYQSCPVAEDIAGKILCLPLYFDLTTQEQKTICRAIEEVILVG